MASHDLRGLLDADQRLLLRAALLSGPSASSAWAIWRRRGGDIDRMQTFGLLPLIYRNLEANGLDEPDLARVKGVYRHTWANNQRLAQRAAPALAVLAGAGIRTMVLKGAAASVLHYRGAGKRPVDALDVLVPPRDGGGALRVLHDAGWSLLAPISHERLLRSVHACALTEPGGARIDLHWRALPESVRDDDFWSASVPVRIGGVSTLAPGPAEQLLHSCALAVGIGQTPLPWIADAAVVIQSAGADLPWPRLVHGATVRQIGLRTATALAVLRDVVAAPIPAGILAELDALPRSLRERVGHRIALHPVPLGSYVQFWDRYRRLVAAERDTSAPDDFLQYLADVQHLPSRRAIASRLARRATELAPHPMRRRPT